MRCQNVTECFEEIKTYCNNISTGYPFIVNTEDYDVYHQLITWLRSDPSKHFVYVSDFCEETKLPCIPDAYVSAFSSKDTVLIGLSQAGMLRSRQSLEELLDMLIGEKTTGHTVVLLNHCRDYLLKHCARDVRLDRRILFVETGMVMQLPQISLIQSADGEAHPHVIDGIRQLLICLEQMTNEKAEDSKIIMVSTKYPVSLFKHAIYAVTQGAGVYELLCEQYPDIADMTEKSYGTEEQWLWLNKALKETGSFSKLVNQTFHTVDSLDFKISDVLSDGTNIEKWLYWLALKVHTTHNSYLNVAVSAAKYYQDLEQAIYFTLLDKSREDSDFEIAYKDRKSLLKKMPENLKLIAQYCNEVGKKDKDAVYFLTDLTEHEQTTLIQLLSEYEYDKDAVAEILQSASPDLAKYMKEFRFTTNNAKLANESMATELTNYFEAYKWQKLTNRITDGFVDIVKKMAEERPYNRLLARTAVIKNMQCRKAQAYFLDALGVEYLAYIAEKCREYGMLSEIHIGHADLPSITSINKDFDKCFDAEYVNIKELDELKHGVNRFNYEKVKIPTHLISELEVIDKLLRNIQRDLLQGQFTEAVIVSDHGASRLAVIYESEDESVIEMPEKGKHGGRCCLVPDNPEIPYAAYENGYSILANYDRFKGSRKADVEVHGGATLEEVLVPIIRLSIKPDKVMYSFVESVIFVKIKQDTTLTLFCNVPMEEPRLYIKNKFYEGAFTTNDQKHAKFVLSDIHRKNKYKAEIYEGDIATGVILDFEVKKQTREVDFGF